MTMASPPRYVPTLTEVVVPAGAAAQPMPRVAPSLMHAEPVDDQRVVVQDVMDRLTPRLEAHLRRSASDLLEMHLREVLPALQMELEAEVRRAVAEALANPSPQNL